MKRTVLLAVSLLLMAFCLFGCSSGSSSVSSSQNEVEWPQGGLFDMIPVGAETCFNSYENQDDAHVSFKGDKDRFKAYLDECSQMGFTVDTKLNGSNYDAYNEDGYSVHIVCFSSGEKDPYITVDIDKPKTNSDLRWPTQGAASMLPDPKKAKGSISADSNKAFQAYVGEMSREEYDAYVDQCMNKGFTVDYQRGADGNFNAEDSKGNKLYLRYEGFKTMYIDLSLKESLSDSSSNSDSATSDSAKSATSSSEKDSSTKSDSGNKSSSNSSSKSSSSSSSSSSPNGKMARDEVEKNAVQELYLQLTKLSDIYTNLDPGSCKYKIGTVEWNSILDQWEVNGTVRYVDKYGSAMKCTGGYSKSFTVYVSDSGITSCNSF